MDSYDSTKLIGYKIRFAKQNDVPVILNFIKALAQYENMIQDVAANEEILSESLFKQRYAEVIIGEFNGVPVGFALFFHNFSTFIGRPGIYLEDIFLKPEVRGKGYGKKLIEFIANIAIERQCGRFEWSCLNWNKPSIKFYEGLGAVSMDEWRVYRLHAKALIEVANNLNK